MRRGRRELPDSVRRAVERQHPGAFNVPQTKAFEREAHQQIQPVQLVGNGAPGWKDSRKRKYGNTVVFDETTGERFDSKLEHRIYTALVARFGQRNVARQWSIMLPGGIRMRPDFVVLGHDDQGRRTIERVIDAKGAPATSDWTNKAKLLASTFKLHVEIVRKVSEI